MSDIRSHFRPYMDKHGMIQPHKADGRSSGNGTLFTAQYIAALFKVGVIPVGEYERLVEVYEKTQLKPGLFMRAPDNLTQQDSPDNYVGIGLASWFLDKRIAANILKYGDSTFPRYVYNNVNPNRFNLSAWIGRQRQVICHLKHAARIQPWFWERVWWAIAIFISARGEKMDQDNWILSWCLVKVGGNKGVLERIVSKYWIKKLKENWPHGLGQILESYFHQRILIQPDGATHPNAEYLWDEFGEW